MRLAQDLARLLFLVALVGAPAWAAWRLPYPPSASGKLSVLEVLMRGAVAVITHLIVLGLLRRALPKPRPGEHRVVPEGPYLIQALSRALVEMATLPVFRGPMILFHFGRVLHLDLLGAKVGWDVGLPVDLEIREPALFEVGRGSVIEPGVVVETATLRAGRAHVAPVSVGERCVLGAQVVLLPGVVVAHDVRVEPGALLADDVQVGVSAVVGPGCRLSRGVTVGAHASVGAGAVLAEGVTVGERARVMAGAFVPAGTHIVDHARFPPAGR